VCASGYRTPCSTSRTIQCKLRESIFFCLFKLCSIFCALSPLSSFASRFGARFDSQLPPLKHRPAVVFSLVSFSTAAAKRPAAGYSRLASTRRLPSLAFPPQPPPLPKRPAIHSSHVDPPPPPFFSSSLTRCRQADPPLVAPLIVFLFFHPFFLFPFPVPFSLVQTLPHAAAIQPVRINDAQ
jgi:hypothetical protein